MRKQNQRASTISSRQLQATGLRRISHAFLAFVLLAAAPAGCSAAAGEASGDSRDALTATSPQLASRCGNGVCEVGESGLDNCPADCRDEWLSLPGAYADYGPDSLFPNGIDAVANKPVKPTIEQRMLGDVTVQLGTWKVFKWTYLPPEVSRELLETGEPPDSWDTETRRLDASYRMYLPDLGGQLPTAVLVSATQSSEGWDEREPDWAEIARTTGHPVFVTAYQPAFWEEHGGITGLAVATRMAVQLRSLELEPELLDEIAVDPQNTNHELEDQLLTVNRWNITWPLLVKNVRSLTLAQQLIDEFYGPSPQVRFASTGGSKQGWAHWLFAATDHRLSYVAPSRMQLQDMDEVYNRVYTDWGCNPLNYPHRYGGPSAPSFDTPPAQDNTEMFTTAAKWFAFDATGRFFVELFSPASFFAMVEGRSDLEIGVAAQDTGWTYQAPPVGYEPTHDNQFWLGAQSAWFRKLLGDDRYNRDGVVAVRFLREHGDLEPAANLHLLASMIEADDANTTMGVLSKQTSVDIQHQANKTLLEFTAKVLSDPNSADPTVTLHALAAPHEKGPRDRAWHQHIDTQWIGRTMTLTGRRSTPHGEVLSYQLEVDTTRLDPSFAWYVTAELELGSGETLRDASLVAFENEGAPKSCAP